MAEFTRHGHVLGMDAMTSDETADMLKVTKARCGALQFCSVCKTDLARYMSYMSNNQLDKWPYTTEYFLDEKHKTRKTP